MDKNSDKRHDPIGLERLKEVGREDGGGHSAGGDGRDSVGVDVVLGTLLGKGLCEANQGELGSRVVGLAKVAIKTSSRAGVDDSSELLFPEVRPCGKSALVCTSDVNLGEKIPIPIGQVLEADVTQDTGVVEEDIDATEGLDGSVDDLVSKFDAVVVGNSLAASFLNLFDDDISSLWVVSVSDYVARNSHRPVILTHLGRV